MAYDKTKNDGRALRMFIEAGEMRGKYLTRGGADDCTGKGIAV
jgi:hypothetical protein